ncbi:hypothetical protein [Streptacidiphilus sp. MAP5-3]|uniref:hypothetical protein n=1 Tax=unclassified Streptacidiphilus TaxID=2643834 RepID=UPI0035191A17
MIRPPLKHLRVPIAALGLLLGAAFAAPASAAAATPASHSAVPAVTIQQPTLVTMPTGQVVGLSHVTPDSKSHTYTFKVSAPASECASLAKAYPKLKAGKSCENTETIYVGPKQMHIRKATAYAPATVWYTAVTSDEQCSVLYRCTGWHQSVSAQFEFNGGWVANDYLDCNDSGGIFYVVSVTWCGTWNNGATIASGGKMNAGDDFNISAVVKSIPIGGSHATRIWCTVDGQLSYTTPY